MNYSAEPASRSRNDVEGVRQLDIAVSVLAEEIRQLSSKPWRCGNLVTDPSTIAVENDMRHPPGTHLNRLSILAWELSGLRAQCVTVAGRRNNTAQGEVRYISVGHVSFRVSEAEETKVFSSLQRGVVSAMSLRMSAMRERIEAAAEELWARGQGDEGKKLKVVWCGVAFALFEDAERAGQMEALLNEEFRKVVAPLYEARMQELRDALAKIST